MDIRIGNGFDIHKLAPGAPYTLWRDYSSKRDVAHSMEM